MTVAEPDATRRAHISKPLSTRISASTPLWQDLSTTNPQHSTEKLTLVVYAIPSHIATMAEIALIASIVRIADTGYRLSLKLYTSGEAISSADRAVITISKDISLTSTVLEELGEILRRNEDEKERICSENLVQTAGNTVKECLDVQY